MLRVTRRLTPAVNEGILITVAVYVCFYVGTILLSCLLFCVCVVCGSELSIRPLQRQINGKHFTPIQIEPNRYDVRCTIGTMTHSINLIKLRLSRYFF
jgi:hypothetical protein